MNALSKLKEEQLVDLYNAVLSARLRRPQFISSLVSFLLDFFEWCVLTLELSSCISEIPNDSDILFSHSMIGLPSLVQKFCQRSTDTKSQSEFFAVEALNCLST